MTVSSTRMGHDALASMARLWRAQEVGTMADEAVRALLRIKRGESVESNEVALNNAATFVGALKDQLASPASGPSTLRLTRLIRVTHPDSATGPEPKSIDRGQAVEALDHLASDVHAVLNKTATEVQLQGVLETFDSIASATHVTSNPSLSQKPLWSTLTT